MATEKKCGQKVETRIAKTLHDKFEAMKYPESNIVIARKKSVQCEGCGAAIAEGNSYCGECLCED